MLRALRLVVDTGIHCFGMTYAEGVDMYTNNLACSDEEIINEIIRYITLPGQACAYTVGKLKIQELRETTSRELGGDFDIRAFHDAILRCGSSPLTVLEKQIDLFIMKNKKT